METKLFTLQEAATMGRLGAVALRKRCARGEAGKLYGKTYLLTVDEVRKLQAEGYRCAGRPRKSD